jgi:hypothetical protein
MACVGDMDCPSGYLCTTAAVTSIGGATGRQCVPVAGACGGTVSACTDDDREEDDTRAQVESAPALTSATHQLVSCPLESGADDDWFRIQVASDSKIRAWTEAGSASDLDLTLYRADGNYVTTSRGATSDEGLTRFLTAGTYFLLVGARLSSSGTIGRNPYALHYEQVVGRGCVDDLAENDDNPGQARPQPLFWGTTLRDNQICTGDDDWFQVDLVAGETLILDLTFTQSNPTQNLDIHLHDRNSIDLTPCKDLQPQTCTAAHGQGDSSNEHLEYTVPGTCAGLCTYYVRIHGRSGSENRYDLTIDKLP